MCIVFISAQVNASVRVDASQPPGLLITNGEFTAFHSAQFDPTATSAPNQVYVAAGNSGPVHFTTSSFWGPTDAIANLYGTGLSSCLLKHPLMNVTKM